MQYGYARVSIEDQELRLQTDALQAAGCEKIYEARKTGGTLERPRLRQLLMNIRAGDHLVVYKLG